MLPLLLFWSVLTFHSAPVPSGYEQAIAALPSGHWALVTGVVLTDRPNDGGTYADRHIELPRRPEPWILTHEVGHVIAIAHPELEAAYWESTAHGRLDIHESFAEAYRAAVEGRPHRAAAWMHEHVLVPLAAPPAPVTVPEIAPLAGPLCPGAAMVPAGAIVHGCSLVPVGSVR